MPLRLIERLAGGHQTEAVLHSPASKTTSTRPVPRTSSGECSQSCPASTSIDPLALTMISSRSTNATVSVSTDGKTATLTLAGKTMQVVIASPATGASFTTQEAVRLSQSPAMPAQPTYNGVLELGDQPNPGVTVLTIVVPAGSTSLQVLFNPQWPGASASDFVTPPNVAVSSWSTTSHN